MKKNLVIHISHSSQISTEHVHEIGVAAYGTTNRYSRQKFIHNIDQVISIKFDKDLVDKSLMYLPSRTHTNLRYLQPYLYHIHIGPPR